MKIIGCSFNKQSGPDATNTYKLEFAIDESQRNGLLDLAKSLKKGSEVLLLIFDAVKEENEIKELVNETPEQTKSRFNKRMHALINEISLEKKISTDLIKESLKKFLIGKKLIKESTKELDLNGYSMAIYYLSNEYGI
jgi:nucleotidyltransferase/DNA polymerase involved in DNA repair